MSRFNPKDIYYYDHKEGDPLRLSIAELRAFMKRWPFKASTGWNEGSYLEKFGLSSEEWVEIQKSREEDVRLEFIGAHVSFYHLGESEMGERDYISFGLLNRDSVESFGVPDKDISLYLPYEYEDGVNLKTLCSKFQDTSIGRIKIGDLSLVRYTNTNPAPEPQWVFQPGVLCPIW